MALFPQVSYPGIIAPRGASYTCSHGISPGTVNLTCVEQFDANGNPILPSEVGNVVIGDGETQVTIPGCRVDNIKMDFPGGQERLWTVCLKDRRWLWAGFGSIFGSYNQLDPHNKLIAWTIRSPTELATLCMNSLGETGYTLALPPGLNSAWGQNLQQFLQPNFNFPPTGVNPPINWNGDTPAIALQQVADLFGCRIVYDVLNNVFLVVPIGVGTGLPSGAIRQYGPSLKQIAVPDGIRVFGDKTKFQMRLLLEPVGLEWDGTYQLLHDLSYAPFINSSLQITDVLFNRAAGGAIAVNLNTPLTVNGVWDLTINTVLFRVLTNPGDTVFTASTALKAAVQASNNPLVRGVVTITAAANPNDPTLTITGVVFGGFFAVQALSENALNLIDGTTMTARLRQAAVRGERGFDMETPGDFSGVVSTDHLTYAQAVQLASDSVFKCYRVRNVDASGSGPINVPGYGAIPNRYQLLLTPTLVEQAVPVRPNQNYSRDDSILDPDSRFLQQLGAGFLDDFLESTYDGYSRDLPFRLYGSYSGETGNVTYLNYFNQNTYATDRIFVNGAEIIAEYQVVKFPIYLYRAAGGGRIAGCNLTLETGCFLRENVTNEFARFNLTRRLRPGTTGNFYDTQTHLDVSLGVIGTYNFFPSNSFLQGSGLPQISRVTISCVTTTTKMPAGLVFEVRVAGILYSYTTMANDTPLIVATWFSNNIPNNQQYTVSLEDAAPGTVGVPNQLPPTTYGPDGATTYYFVVTALSPNGETTVSNEQSCQVDPFEPTIIRWQTVPNATGYNVYASTTTGTYTMLIATVGPNVDEYGWQPILFPHFTVSAVLVNPVGLERPVFGVEGHYVGNNIVLTWQPVANAIFYNVFWLDRAGTWHFLVQIRSSDPLTYTWVNGGSTTQTPPIVNTATISLPVARFRITGQQNGVNLMVTAAWFLGVNTPNSWASVVNATASIIQQALQDQRDYWSRLVNTNILEADPIFRANYYLDGMLLKYQTKVVNTVIYNKIVPISCNGAIAQVTWEVGDGKPSQTTASINCEHSDYVPPYPDRRRAEGLAGVLPNQNQNVLVDNVRDAVNFNF